MDCPACRHAAPDDLDFCDFCGTQLRAVRAPAPLSPVPGLTPPAPAPYQWMVHDAAGPFGWMTMGERGGFGFVGDVGLAMIRVLERLHGIMPQAPASGPFLNWFLPGELRRLTDGTLWAEPVGTKRDVVPAIGGGYGPSRYRRNSLPEPLAPDGLLRGTRDGSVVWARTGEGHGFKAGGTLGDRRGVWVTLTEVSGGWAMLTTHGEHVVGAVRQKDGLLARCTLGKLWRAIEPEQPLPVPAPPPGGPRQLAAAGTTVRLPEGAIDDLGWGLHLHEGRVMERLLLGDSALVAVDVAHLPPLPGMGYTWRMFVLPAGGRAPVLAFNHERSAFGTVAFGMHRAGEPHAHLGEAPAEVSWEAFRARALATLVPALTEVAADR